jgi:two-component system CheB/CheR fusion protein
VIDGLVLTFSDVHALKDLKLDLIEARRLETCYENILDTIQRPLVVLDKGTKIITANQSFYTTFKTQVDDAKGKTFWELDGKAWDTSALRKRLAEAVSKGNEFEGLELACDFPRVGRKRLLIKGTRVQGEQGQSERLLLTIEDVTSEEEQVQGIRFKVQGKTRPWTCDLRP